MKLIKRKSKLERMMEALESNEIIKSAALKAVDTAVTNAASPHHEVKSSNPFGKKATSGLAWAAAGVAALTAVSAVSAKVSSMRRNESTV